MNLTTAEMTKIAIALAICYGAYRYSTSTPVKAMALGVAGTIIAKQIPYVQEALA